MQIGDHVREDNKMLNGMDQFDTSGSMLGGTVKRPTALANSRDGWHTAYLAIFCGPRVSLHLPDDAIASNSTFITLFPPQSCYTNANTTQPSGTKRWTVWGTCPRPVAHVCWGLSTWCGRGYVCPPIFPSLRGGGCSHFPSVPFFSPIALRSATPATSPMRKKPQARQSNCAPT